MQPLSQVSDALIHHGHLGVPFVQQLLVLGQLAALLQVVTVTSLRDTTSDVKPILNAFLYQTQVMCILPAAPGRVSSAPGLQDQTGLILSGQSAHQGTQSAPSGAGDVLSVNPPTAGSTGKSIRADVSEPIQPDFGTVRVEPLLLPGRL